MEENTFYYLFSTIAQTYAAVVGILGMLVVYRLQWWSTWKRDRQEALKKPAIIVYGDTFSDYSDYDFDERFVEHMKEQKKTVWDDSLTKEERIIAANRPGLRKVQEIIDSILKQFKRFLSVHLAIIILAILSIFASEILAHDPFVAYLVFCTVIAVLMFSSRQIFKLILEIIHI